MNRLPGAEMWQKWFFDALAQPGELDDALRVAARSTALPEDSEHLREVLAPSPSLRPEQRLSIYREMYWLRLVEALTQDYPALRAAVGDDAFQDLATRYVGDRPSTTFTLNLYGAGLPDWLQLQGQILEHHPFLADLARLEWARVEVLHERRSEVIGLDQVQGIPPEAWPAAILRLVPAHRVLTLGHRLGPWYRAWRRGELLDPPPPEVSHVLLCRRNDGLQCLDLDDAGLVLLRSLARGESLAAALAAASEEDAERTRDQLGAWFQEWSRAGLFAAVLQSA